MLYTGSPKYNELDCMLLCEFSQPTNLDENHSQITNNLAHELTGMH